MGYQTSFWGEIRLSPPLDRQTVRLLVAFSEKRHCNVWGEHENSTLPVNIADPRVIDYNKPHPKLPSLWCDWFPSPAGDKLVLKGSRIYRYTEWLAYLMQNFIIPAGSGVYGTLRWCGENAEDFGTIMAVGNQIFVDGAVTHAGTNPYVEDYLTWEFQVVSEMGGILHSRK